MRERRGAAVLGQNMRKTATNRNSLARFLQHICRATP